MSGAQSLAFPLVGLFVPLEFLLARDSWKNASLVALVIFFSPSSGPLKLTLSYQFCIVNPTVLGWFSALYIVLLGRIPFKMIPGSSHWEVLQIQEKTYTTLLHYQQMFTSFFFALLPQAQTLGETYQSLPHDLLETLLTCIAWENDTCSQWNMGAMFAFPFLSLNYLLYSFIFSLPFYHWIHKPLVVGDRPRDEVA